MAEQNLVTIYIDGIAYQVQSDQNLLANVLAQHLDLPYFCWHPSMGSVGACRQCAVTQFQDEQDDKGRLIMACTAPVTEGMRIGLNHQAASEFREQVISAMMTNHPHDCPVCAEGGECHLQDMTVMTGHSVRHYQGDKRTFNNQYLGQFIGHEMNRCITCYRCVRFYKDYAGGHDLDVFGSKNQVYFGRQQEGQLESEFSGNLVEVCPTGVFTNKMFSAHFSRKWDLQSAPSVCSHCAVGCNTSVGERYGSVRRVVNRFNPDINGHFLCDHGRFGINFVNSINRLSLSKGVKQRSPDKLSKLDVLSCFAHFKGKKLLGIGSGRASLEVNTLLKYLVGAENFSPGFNEQEQQFATIHRNVMSQFTLANIDSIEQSDAIFIIHEDVTQSAGRIALAIRHSLQNISKQKAEQLGVPRWQDAAVRTIGDKELTPLYLLSQYATKLDDVAKVTLLQTPHASSQLLELLTSLIENEQLLDDNASKENSLLNDLLNATCPTLVIGWDSGSSELMRKSIDFFQRLQSKVAGAQLVIVPPKANTLGQISLLDQQSLSIESLIAEVNEQQADGVIVLENELSEHVEKIGAALENTGGKLIVLDHSEHPLTKLADIILPCTPVTEGNGHFVNYQGVVQRFVSVLPPQLPIQESWRWLNTLFESIKPHHPLAAPCHNLSSLHQALATQDEFWHHLDSDKVINTPRETHRTSGRTAKMANQSVHEVKVTESTDDFCYSMEGDFSSKDNVKAFTWSPGWNSGQSAFQQSAQHISTTTLNFNALNAEYLLKVSNSVATHYSLLVMQPWYQRDWQSADIAEFRLLATDDLLFVSSQEAQENDWQQGQYLVIVTINSDKITTFIARLMIDPRLSQDMRYANLIDCKKRSLNVEHINIANDEQVANYQALLKERTKHWQQIKEQTLSKLKTRDQYIPIRLVAGGLDDA